ncbi:hypothetical protein N8083_01280 [Candidatus Pacebacteria bacterium]|nr:hypothetical protein [Candidatus Paceibacterota bacterium]
MLFGIEPEQFDILGALAFLFVTIFALVSLFNSKRLPWWSMLLLLFVGLGGLVIDLLIVFTVTLN